MIMTISGVVFLIALFIYIGSIYEQMSGKGERLSRDPRNKM